MTAWICATCGNQHADTPAPPGECAICLDERQYVGAGGQRWTTLAELAAAGHRTEVRELEPGLYGIGVQPEFAIGQRALLVRTGAGNVLWDIPGFIDAAAIERVRELGGLVAVAASHPHFHGVQVEWSHAFGDVPVLVPAADLSWVRRPDPVLRPWAGTHEVLPGVTLVQCGGHFPGSAVLHWRDGAGGRGALLTGDTIGVVADTRYVSFMRSFPNYIPLPERDIDRILAALAPYRYDRIYGGWWPRVVDRDGEAAVRRSAERYLAWQRGERDSAR
ncbi:MAG TPA: hydrolase [Mycobacteriales bacterium]|nr:hydrolase [Mycobacteriales bacterium]